MSKTFADLIAKVNEYGTKKVAVAVAQDSAVLEAVKAAKERKIADAILVGNEKEIREIAASLDMNLDGFEIINVEDKTEAALTAVKLVHDGKADMYMKGLIDTKGFLKSVLTRKWVSVPASLYLMYVCLILRGSTICSSSPTWLSFPTLPWRTKYISSTIHWKSPEPAALKIPRSLLWPLWK